MMGNGFWRLAGWEIERWRDPICRLIVAYKNDRSEIENLLYVVVQLFVQMYRHFEVVLQCVQLDFVYDLVLNLRFLLVLGF